MMKVKNSITLVDDKNYDKVVELAEENERLKSRNNYNLEDCLLEIVELKKKLESLQKVLHLVGCVSDE